MADEDIEIRYVSTGFESLRVQFDEMLKRFDQISEKAASVGEGLKKFSSGIGIGDVVKNFEGISSKVSEVGDKIKEFGGRLGGWFSEAGNAVSGALGPVLSFAEGIGKVGAALVVLAGVGALAAGAAIIKFTENIVMMIDKDKELETSLYGITKSWETVGKISEFSTAYAEKYAVGVNQVQSSIRQLSFVPEARKAISEGDVDMMGRYMDVIMRLRAISPERGIEGATMALRQTLAGQFTMLQRGYAIPVGAMAAQAGMTQTEMSKTPDLAFGALESWTRKAVPTDVLEAQSRLISSQLDRMRDRWIEWLKTIGRTEVYDKVAEYVKKLADAFVGFLASERAVAIAKAIGEALVGMMEMIERIFNTNIDWSKIGNISDLWKTVVQITENAEKELSGAFVSLLSKAVSTAVTVAVKLFIPLGKAILEGIFEGIKQAGEEHPIITAIMATAGGAAAGLMAGGPWGALVGGGLSLLASQLPGQWAVISQVLEALGLKASEASAAVVELKGSLEMLPSHVPFAAPGAGEGEPSETRFLAGWGKIREKLTTPEEESKRAVMPIERQFAMVEAWEKMQARIVKAGQPETYEETEMRIARERAPIREKWQAGQMPIEEWRTTTKKWETEDIRREQTRSMQEEYTGRLQGILKMPNIERFPDMQQKIYSQLFGVSLERGDVGGAKDYQKKMLDAIEASFQKAAGEEDAKKKGQEDNTQALNWNTEEIKKLGEALKSGKMVSLGPEGLPTKPASETPATTPAPASDQIYYSVNGGEPTTLWNG